MRGSRWPSGTRSCTAARETFSTANTGTPGPPAIRCSRPSAPTWRPRSTAAPPAAPAAQAGGPWTRPAPPRRTLPDAIAKAAAAAIAGGRIAGIDRETRDGVITWELTIESAGRDYELRIDAAGAVLAKVEKR